MGVMKKPTVISSEPGDSSTEHFVTVFDFGFAPQGLALYRSLSMHVPNFVLWIVAMDSELEELFSSIGLQNVRVIPVGQIETEELRAVRSTRTPREYCWTLTPFLYDAVFSREDSARRVTYVDADVWILGDITPIFSELEDSGKSIQITEHAFSPERDVSGEFGKYCVQFQTATRDGSSRILARWQDQCLEWCHGTPEAGRFGDQKYLDEWPSLYPDAVHVAKAKHLFLGPWNALRFPYSEGLVYHFHQVRINAGNAKFRLGTYDLPEPLLKNLYEPYIAELKETHRLMRSKGFEPRDQFEPESPRRKIVRLLSPLTDAPYKWFRGTTVVRNLLYKSTTRRNRNSPD